MSKRKEYAEGEIVGYNNVVFLRYTNKDVNDKWKALFRCPLCGNEFDCGNKHFATTHSLRRGDTTSCGCAQKDNGHIQGLKHKKDLTNQNFGKLTALTCTNKKNNNGAYLWYCKCDCGNFCEVSSTNLICGKIKSCGCLLSHGEQIIQNILRELNIGYQTQKTFAQCINPKTNTKLRFDFYLPDYNCCIEYDGIQHFIQRDKRWIHETLQQIQYRDKVKILLPK